MTTKQRTTRTPNEQDPLTMSSDYIPGISIAVDPPQHASATSALGLRMDSPAAESSTSSSRSRVRDLQQQQQQQQLSSPLGMRLRNLRPSLPNEKYAGIYRTRPSFSIQGRRPSILMLPPMSAMPSPVLAPQKQQQQQQQQTEAVPSDLSHLQLPESAVGISSELDTIGEIGDVGEAGEAGGSDDISAIVSRATKRYPNINWALLERISQYNGNKSAGLETFHQTTIVSRGADSFADSPNSLQIARTASPPLDIQTDIRSNSGGGGGGGVHGGGSSMLGEYDEIDEDLKFGELFLGQSAFERPEFRLTFFSPAIGTIRSCSLANLRTKEHSLRDIIAISLVGGSSSNNKDDNNIDGGVRAVGSCFWIDVTDPTMEDMALLRRIFRIHPLTIEDIVSEEPRDKCEKVQQDYMFVCYRTMLEDMTQHNFHSVVMQRPVSASSNANASSTDLKNADKSWRPGDGCCDGDWGGLIVTFHSDQITPHIYNALERVRYLLEYVPLTAHWIGYAIIDDITDSLEPILRAIESEVDEIDSLSLKPSQAQEQQEVLMRISCTRRRLIALLRAFPEKTEVIRAIVKHSTHKASQTTTAATTAAAAETSAAVLRRLHGGSGTHTPTGLPFAISEDEDGESLVMHAGFPFGLSASTRPAKKPTIETSKPSSSGSSGSGSSDSSHDISLYFDDIQDHIITMLATARHLDLILARAHSAYLAQVSLALTETANATNNVASKLTILGSILIPLNIITGLFGMNVTVPMQTGREPGGNPTTTSFWAIFGCMMVWATLTLIFARRYGIV